MKKVLLATSIVLASASAHSEWLTYDQLDPSSDLATYIAFYEENGNANRYIAIACNTNINKPSDTVILTYWANNVKYNNPAGTDIEIRFDKTKMETIFQGMHDHQTTITDDMSLINKMKKHNTMFMQVPTIYNGDQLFNIDLKGFSKAYNEINTKCNT